MDRIGRGHRSAHLDAYARLMAMPARLLEIRGISRDQLSRRPHAGGARRARGAGAARRRPQGGDGGAHRAARGARARPAADRLPRSAVASSRARSIKVQDARDGKFVGSEIPARPAAAVDSGHRPGRQAERAGRDAASATSPTRCCRAPTAGCSTARTRSARSSTMSLDNQRNLKLAIHRDPRVPEGRRAGRRRDEHVGAGVLRPRRSSTTGGSSSTSRRRSSARAACTSTIATSATPTARASPRRSSTRRCTSSTTTSGCATPASSLVAVPAEDPDRRRSGAVERHPLGARDSTSACRPARSRSTCSSSSSRRASS